MRLFFLPVAVSTLLTSTAALAQPRVIITEIMYNPNSNEQRGETEWVEIANVGSESIEINNWRLDDEDQADWGTFSCTLAPGAVAVLINGDAVTEEQFRAAWDVPTGDSEPAHDASEARRYLVIPVSWGGLANSPSSENEILRLRDENDAIICEVNFDDANDWPSFRAGDGPSIYLLDLTATDLNRGNLWARSEAGKTGARNNVKTDIFNGVDIGSPGYVPGLTAQGAVAAAKSDGKTLQPEPSAQVQLPPAAADDDPRNDVIDY